MSGKATISYVDNVVSNQSTLTINTFTTSSTTLNSKSDPVQFKGMNHTAYMNTSPTGMFAYTNLYVDGTIKCKKRYLCTGTYRYKYMGFKK